MSIPGVNQVLAALKDCKAADMPQALAFAKDMISILKDKIQDIQKTVVETIQAWGSRFTIQRDQKTLLMYLKAKNQLEAEHDRVAADLVKLNLGSYGIADNPTRIVVKSGTLDLVGKFLTREKTTVEDRKEVARLLKIINDKIAAQYKIIEDRSGCKVNFELLRLYTIAKMQLESEQKRISK